MITHACLGVNICGEAIILNIPVHMTEIRNKISAPIIKVLE